MQFPVDPAQVNLDVFVWFFLTFLLVVLPLGAVRQHRRHRLGMQLPTRSRIYASAIATHAALLLLVWAVAAEQGLDFLPAYRPAPMHVVIAVVALAVGLLPLLERFRRDDPVARQRVRLIAPRTRKEHAFFYLVALSAGVAEELTYRGALFTFLAAVLGGGVPTGGVWVVAAIASSAAFGIVHLFQGWKSAGIAALMGLREHVVVGLTGTLFVAMIVHMLHDAIAGAVIGRRAQQEEREGMLAVS